MNSCRVSSHLWPVAVKNLIASAHSRLGELDILDERVQVPDQRPQDLPDARIGEPARLAHTTSADRSSLKSSPRSGFAERPVLIRDHSPGAIRRRLVRR